MSNELEARFDDAMMDVYRRALKECDYKATRFLHMLHELAGLKLPGFSSTLPRSRKATLLSGSGNGSI